MAGLRDIPRAVLIDGLTRFCRYIFATVETDGPLLLIIHINRRMARLVQFEEVRVLAEVLI